MFREKYLPREEYIKLPFEERLIKLSNTEDDKASELQEKFISIDMVTLSVLSDEGRYRGQNYPRHRIRNSGLTCLSETIEPPQDSARDATMREVKRYIDFFEKQPDMYVAYCPNDIRRGKKEDKQVIWLSVEMDVSQAIGPGIRVGFGTPEEHYPSLDNIDILYRLGVRRFSAILDFRNYIGDGTFERYDSGLSYYGLAFLERMNKVGMITDLAHWGEKSSFDAIEASENPLVISHSGARALIPKNKRLKSDELIKALVEKGGILGVCGIPNYLAQTKRQGIKNVLDHIDYIVNLVGVDYVALGTDIIFGHHAADPVHYYYLRNMGLEVAAEYMEGIESVEEWPNIIRGLVARGYSDQEIEKIIGGNTLRVMDKITK